MPRFRSIVTASSAVATALLAFAAPAASATPRPAIAHGFAPSAAAGSFDYFSGASCASGTPFCMAVGQYRSGSRYRGLSEVLSNGFWVTKAVPSPAVNRNVFVNEVSCASPGWCLLVGQHYSKTTGANLAEFWNGTAWKIASSQGPRDSTSSGLRDVSCPATRWCLVVGYAYTGRRYYATAYTWTSPSTWKQVQVPGPRGARDTELAGLACADATDCVAVGNYVSPGGKNLPYAARWHHGTWNVQPMPALPRVSNSILEADSCPAPGLCVAAGTAGTTIRTSHAFAEIYRAGKWHLAATGAVGTVLIGASCPTTHLCLLSGYGSRRPGALAWKWNGHTWTNMSPYRPGSALRYDFFEHAYCTVALGCLVVGGRYNSRTEHTLAETWGGTWGILSPLNP